MGTTFWSVRSKFKVRMAGVTFTTRTPKGTRIESELRWMMRSPSPEPARLIWAETSPGPRAWMIPGEARSRTSTLLTASPVSSRFAGKFWSSTGTVSPRSELFSPAMTNQSTVARARLASFRGRFSKRAFIILAFLLSLLARRHRFAGRGLGAGTGLPLEAVEQGLPELAPVQLTADPALLHQGDDAGLLGNHHRHRVRVLGQPDRGAVAAPQGPRELGVDGQGEEAGRRRRPVALDDHSRARGGEGGGGEHHLVDHLFLALAGEGPQERRLAQAGQHLPDLGLEDHDDAEHHEGQERAEQQVHGLQVGEQGRPVEHDQHERPQRHLHRVGPAQEQEKLVDDEGDEQDVENVPPGERGGREGLHQALRDHGAPPPSRIASHTRTTWTISATSCTRTTWAPPSTAAATAAAVPKRRSPTGRSSTFPMKLFREGPTRTGRSRRRSSGRRRRTSRLCPALLAKPIPGSTITRSRGTPPSSPRRSAASSSAATSPITSE